MRRASLVLLVLLAACSDDPADPCAGIACDVEGVDLALTVADIEWSGDQAYDTRVGLRVVEPSDELRFRFRVVNLGNQTSAPATLWIGSELRLGNLNQHDPRYGDRLDVPALEPGESFGGERTFQAPPDRVLGDPEVEPTMRIESESWVPYSDADLSNNTAAFRYHLAVPHIVVSLTASSDTLSVGEAREVTVTLFNASYFAATEEPIEGGFCVMYRDVFGGYDCWGSYDELRAMPSLAPREVAQLEFTVELPGRMLPLDRAAPNAELFFCAGREQLGALLGRTCNEPISLAVVQDLDAACTPPTVDIGETLSATDASAECPHPSALSADQYHVWAFETDTSGLHRLDLIAGSLEHVRVFDSDHARIPLSASGEFFVHEGGRYHVLVQPTAIQYSYRLE